MISLLRHGSAAQQKAWLWPLANGDIRSCFAMTEPPPGAGSDPSMLKTSAVRSGEGWLIDGHKWFITGAVGARFAIVLAQTPEGPTQFIVETDNPGYRLLRAIRAIDPFAIGLPVDACTADVQNRSGTTHDFQHVFQPFYVNIAH